MRGRILPDLLVALALMVLAPAARAGEGGETKPAEGDSIYEGTKILTEMNKTLQKHQEDDMAKQQADSNVKKQEWDKAFKEVTAPRKGQFEFNGKTVSFDEPRRDSEVVPVPKEPHKIWSLKPEDFQFDLPVEVYESRVLGEGLLGRDKVYLVLPFLIKNSLADEEKDAAGKVTKSTPVKAELAPRLTMITDKGSFKPETVSFLVHQAVEASTFRRTAWTPELIGFVRESKDKVGVFEPGQTRAGVAIFPRYDLDATSVQILIEGLSNEFNFRKDLRKALILEFVRPGNIFYPGQVKLAFKRRLGGHLEDPKDGYLPARDDDAHHGFDWVWLWNWESAAATSDPKSAELPTPTGLEKQKFWHYKVTLTNRTGREQPLTIERVNTIVRVELLGKTVEVPFPDDGKLNVYKTDFFEKEGLPASPKRFPENAKVPAGEDNTASFLVAFRESDYDIDAVYRNLTNAFALDAIRAREKAGQNKDQKVGEAAAEFLGAVKFGKAEMEKARKELEEKLPAALAEQLKVRVVAEMTVKSGLASGTREVNYSLYKPAYTGAAVGAVNK